MFTTHIARLTLAAATLAASAALAPSTPSASPVSAAAPYKAQICHFQNHADDWVYGGVSNLADECIASGGQLKEVTSRSCTDQHAAATVEYFRTLYTCDGLVFPEPQ